MLLESRFFNSENKDRVYFAEDFAEYFSSFVGNGVNPNNFENERDFQGFKVESKEGMTLKINKGSAIIEGYYAKTLNNDDIEVKIDVADNRDRIDRIVLRLDYEKRMIDLVVLKGSISETAKPQDIVRNDDYYDLAIADVVVKGNSSHILQSNIKDTREDKTLCGWVETLISGNFEQIKKDFDEFVAKVEGITGGFQGQIDDINNYQIKAGSGLRGGGLIRNNPILSLDFSDKVRKGSISLTAEKGDEDWRKNIFQMGRNDYCIIFTSRRSAVIYMDRLIEVGICSLNTRTGSFIKRIKDYSARTSELEFSESQDYSDGDIVIKQYANGSVSFGVKANGGAVTCDFEWFFIKR